MKINSLSEHIKKLVIVFIGAILNAFAMNYFLKPANVYASGFTGISQLLSKIITQFTPLNVSTGLLLFLLNIPVAILGWKRSAKCLHYTVLYR